MGSVRAKVKSMRSAAGGRKSRMAPGKGTKSGGMRSNMGTARKRAVGKTGGLRSVAKKAVRSAGKRGGLGGRMGRMAKRMSRRVSTRAAPTRRSAVRAAPKRASRISRRQYNK